MEWYRMYHGMPFDPKLQVVAKRACQPMGLVVVVWVCILDAASQHNPRGIANIDLEEIAVVQGLELDAVEAIWKSLIAKKLIDKDGYLTAWDKRQHTTSTERMKKHRERKKSDVTTGDNQKKKVTRRDAMKRKKGKISPDTDTDTDTEADTDSEESSEAETDSKTKSDKKSSEREEKEEHEKEKQPGCGKEPELDENQILQQMADIWNAEVQSKITPDQNAILTAKRKELLKARWVDEFAEDIRAWRYFCEIIGKSDFCLGKLEGKDWTIDLTWAVHSADRVAKILEGGFSGGKHPSKPPSCNLPEYADSWDDVIRRMEYHHGRAAIRSWFTGTVVTAATDAPDGVMLTLECPTKFIHDWITDHFLTDLCLCWDSAACARPVAGMQLTIKEATL